MGAIVAGDTGNSCHLLYLSLAMAKSCTDKDSHLGQREWLASSSCFRLATEQDIDMMQCALRRTMNSAHVCVLVKFIICI